MTASSSGHPQVLASSVRTLTDSGYSRAFNVLDNLPEGLQVTALADSTESDLTNDRITIETVASNRLFYSKLQQSQKIRSLLNTGDFDVYHRFNYMYGDLAPALWTDSDTPSVIGPVETHHDFNRSHFDHFLWSDGLDMTPPPEPMPTLVYHTVMSGYKLVNPPRMHLFRRALQNADAIIAPNQSTRDVYAEFVSNPEKIRIIPFGTRLDNFPYSPAPESKNLLYVGNLSSRKAPIDLIEILPRVLKTHPDAHLHIVGTGPQEDMIRDRMAMLGIEDSVTLHGYISFEDLVRQYEQASLFLHPSHSEGYSHVRLEAMAAGCVVVGTDLTGATDMVKPGDTGLLYPPGETSTLAKQLTALLDDPDRIARLAANARARVEERHDWTDIAAQYADLYKELAQNSS